MVERGYQAMTTIAGMTSGIASAAMEGPNETTVQVLNITLNALGTVCAGCPFLLPVQHALRSLTQSMQVCNIDHEFLLSA